MKYVRLLFSLLILGFASHANSSTDTYFATGLIPHWTQAPDADASVTGMRFSAGAASHKEMYGLDIGVIGNFTSSKFVGTAMSGAFNFTDGSASIVLLQLAGGVNVNNGKANIYGIQLAPFANINRGDGNVFGMQMSVGANVSPKTNIYGFQFGLYNEANQVYGFQVGLINRAQRLHGIQIGLSNYNASGWLAWFPLLNVGF